MDKQVKKRINFLIQLSKQNQNTLIYNELKKLKNELKKQNQNGTI
jgi:hypothetical protein